MKFLFLLLCFLQFVWQILLRHIQTKFCTNLHIITGREEHFKSVFKRKKDFYRRYRDLSIFCIAGVYLLSIVDAYVDAELSTFDISRDLSMKIAPGMISSSSVHNVNPLAGSPGISIQLNY